MTKNDDKGGDTAAVLDTAARRVVHEFIRTDLGVVGGEELVTEHAIRRFEFREGKLFFCDSNAIDVVRVGLNRALVEAYAPGEGARVRLQKESEALSSWCLTRLVGPLAAAQRRATATSEEWISKTLRCPRCGGCGADHPRVRIMVASTHSWGGEQDASLVCCTVCGHRGSAGDWRRIEAMQRDARQVTS